ncbi:methyltransferase type 11 [Paenibacillus sp. J53TS2]|uniref:methyltransferase domain-containing protein n=1 Tax=Paenibacillus sp. J53TS2 TaxID=2807197 RepID=UPI001B153942|nr:methyltransferase domain-containing protein [Paenibacillus sp. J53TS2]GIP47484.1 methyltransferase type 11 [Paenibacillus sp. J53TS2]
MNDPPNRSTSKPNSHDHRHATSRPGVELLTWLHPLPGERILDLGCGNGDLTAAIAAAGAIPTGIDASEEMIHRAKQRYPELDLQVGDARHYRSDRHYDDVFSHAALHWIQDAPAVTETIRLALRKGGRLAVEFAGKGNVAALTRAIEQVMKTHGYPWEGRNPWYHPSIGEYASLLERVGFRVTFARHLDLPTPLKGEAAVRKWLDSFADYFFTGIPSSERAPLYDAIVSLAKPALYKEGQWMLDTSRLRVMAIKERE